MNYNSPDGISGVVTFPEWLLYGCVNCDEAHWELFGYDLPYCCDTKMVILDNDY